jgi:hypothetical protein
MHKRTVEKDRGSSVSGKATFFLHNSFLLHSYILYWSCTSPVLVLYWSCTQPNHFLSTWYLLPDGSYLQGGRLRSCG